MLHVVKTVAELRQEAKERSIRGYSKMKKHELREALGYTAFNYEDRHIERRHVGDMFTGKKDYQIEVEDIIKRNEEIRKQTEEAVKQADEIQKQTDEAVRKADEAMRSTHEIIRRSRELSRETEEAIRQSEERRRETQEILRKGNELLKTLEEKREKEKINREKKLERELENLEVWDDGGEENVGSEGNNANVEDDSVVKGESDEKGKSENKGDGDREKEQCKVCFYYKRTHICAPCGHMVFCAKCAYDYEKSCRSGQTKTPVCPVCKERVTSFIKVYMP